MIANYANHAANERTFLAWIRTGLAVAVFGFLLIKLNLFVDAIGRGSIFHLPSEDAVAAATRHAGMAMGAIGIGILHEAASPLSDTRRAIDRDELIRIPPSRAASIPSAALATALLIFCLDLARI